ncbi:MAG: hypothetical protein QXI58_04170 [Candidatus Micrarchaeia archaeon]
MIDKIIAARELNRVIKSFDWKAMRYRKLCPHCLSTKVVSEYFKYHKCLKCKRKYEIMAEVYIGEKEFNEIIELRKEVIEDVEL